MSRQFIFFRSNLFPLYVTTKSANFITSRNCLTILLSSLFFASLGVTTAPKVSSNIQHAAHDRRNQSSVTSSGEIFTSRLFTLSSHVSTSTLILLFSMSRNKIRGADTCSNGFLHTLQYILPLYHSALLWQEGHSGFFCVFKGDFLSIRLSREALPSDSTTP